MAGQKYNGLIKGLASYLIAKEAGTKQKITFLNTNNKITSKFENEACD
ncbi:hypothetical protein [Niallia taxi]|nr:hypothetical protein [Niallia taxi]